jgi:hypothetical protein
MFSQDYFNKVKKFFLGDEKKTWDWFKNPNPKFGVLSPLNMIKLGRQHKVAQFIDKEMKT